MYQLGRHSGVLDLLNWVTEYILWLAHKNETVDVEVPGEIMRYEYSRQLNRVWLSNFSIGYDY